MSEPKNAPAQRDVISIGFYELAIGAKSEGERNLYGWIAEQSSQADLYFATADLLDAADIMRDGALSLPMPVRPERARSVTLARPYMAGLSRRTESDEGLEERYREGQTVEVGTMTVVEMPRVNELDDIGATYVTLNEDPIEKTALGLFTDDGGPYIEGSAVPVYRLIFWILDNPDLMAKTVTDVAPRQSKAARRRGKPHTPSPVTIVDLRAAHKKAAAEVEHAERIYRHRWIVRGHWHRFWTGPRNGERTLETRYVMPYVKGPEGAPLNRTELVKKW